MRVCLYLKRRLKSLYPFRYVVYSLLFIVFVLLYMAHRWHLFCFNVEVWHHVNTICRDYARESAQGSLCVPLCDSQQLASLTCDSYHTTQETVFSGLWRDTRLIFKSSKSRDGDGMRAPNAMNRYPTEREFVEMVSDLIKTKLNTTVSREIMRRLTHLRATYLRAPTYTQRLTEINNIWTLLHHPDYLIPLVYSDRDLFPQVLGTCGHYFAHEYVPAIPPPFTLWGERASHSKGAWSRHLRTALLLIDFLDEVDNNFREPLHLCDMRLSHFGLNRAGTRVKLLDMRAVHPRSVVARLIANIGRCDTDADCTLLDCTGRCDAVRGVCARAVTNTNLQVACEKVFLGWRMAHRLLIPGLLLSEYAPVALMSMVRECAYADAHNEDADDIRRQLYELLSDIEQTANAN